MARASGRRPSECRASSWFGGAGLARAIWTAELTAALRPRPDRQTSGGAALPVGAWAVSSPTAMLSTWDGSIVRQIRGFRIELGETRSAGRGGRSPRGRRGSARRSVRRRAGDRRLVAYVNPVIRRRRAAAVLEERCRTIWSRLPSYARSACLTRIARGPKAPAGSGMAGHRRKLCRAADAGRRDPRRHRSGRLLGLERVGSGRPLSSILAALTVRRSDVRACAVLSNRDAAARAIRGTGLAELAARARGAAGRRGPLAPPLSACRDRASALSFSRTPLVHRSARTGHTALQHARGAARQRTG